MSLFKIAIGLSATLVGNVAGYSLQKDYTSSFFSDMQFFTQTDPTNGDVDYVSQSEAQSLGLISNGGGSVYMGVQNGSVSGTGRKSVRVSSSQTYDTGLFVIDVEHMPYGCGTWPAFWLVGPSWPNNGEIDIIEGVNSQQSNKMTLHSNSGCSISQGGGMSGTVTSTDCDVTGGSNEGCGIMANGQGSYGAGLNQAGGGVYATEVTSDGVNIWFWSKGSAPSDATGSSPTPSGWGQPTAQFSGCDISSHFKDMSIVFDTTFCGDWAGDTWSSDSTCSSKASSCEAYVNNPPEGAFDDAYWRVNALKVYSGSGSSSSGGNSGNGNGGSANGGGSGTGSGSGSGSSSPPSNSGSNNQPGSGSGGNGNGPSSTLATSSQPQQTQVGQGQGGQGQNAPQPTPAPEPTPPTPGEPLAESWFEPPGGFHRHGGGHWHRRRHFYRRAHA